MGLQTRPSAGTAEGSFAQLRTSSEDVSLRTRKKGEVSLIHCMSKKRLRVENMAGDNVE